MLDLLLVYCLIEVCSYECLGLFVDYCNDFELVKFYSSLMVFEVRYYGVYWILVIIYFKQKIVEKRLEELVIFESEILSNLYLES